MPSVSCGGNMNNLDPTDVCDPLEPLEPPDEFAFPFTPYDSQKDFMRQLYLAIEQRKLGIFESPTGTGKSMSLICGAMRWLVDHEKREVLAAKQLLSSLSTPLPSSNSTSAAAAFSWVDEQLAERGRQLQLLQARRRLEKIRKSRAKFVAHARRDFPPEPASGDNYDASAAEAAVDNHEDEDLVEARESDAERLSDSDLDTERDNEEEPYQRTQIIYASRTHSQLSQFAAELRRSPFYSNVDFDAASVIGNDEDINDHGQVRCVSVASRQQLCVHRPVSQLPHTSLVNQACLDLQRQRPADRARERQRERAAEQVSAKRRKLAPSVAGCPFKTRARLVAEKMLCDVMDVEQLVDTSRRVAGCGYYAGRLAIPSARLLLLPYHSLLHADTRRALGVRLAGSVVIIDEAHNLLDTVFAVHAARVERRHLSLAARQLRHYVELFRRRLAPVSLLRLRQLTAVVGGLLRAFGRCSSVGGSGTARSRVLSVSELVTEALVDNLSLHQLVQFGESTRLAQKLRSCWNRRQSAGTHITSSTAGVSSFLHQLQTDKHSNTGHTNNKATVTSTDDNLVESELCLPPCLQLMSALANAEPSARVLVVMDGGNSSGGSGSANSDATDESYIKFLPLDIAARFRDIVTQARCVILAGGTMRPVSEFIDRLFVVSSDAGATAADRQRDRVVVFSCGHVISPQQLLCTTLSRGPSGQQLLCTMQHRCQPHMLNEVGSVLLNCSRVVPGGVVCFLPSYLMLDKLFAHLTNSGLLAKISSKKKVFRESRLSCGVDDVLSQYSRVIHSTSEHHGSQAALTGALLFSVVGGKMSEGINFSDALGRCVVVVGMPYANLASPELQQKMKHLDATMVVDKDGRKPGQVFYENLCMKAVNQSIGRAIRHRGDYACVLLCDCRYARPASVAYLPEWLRDGVFHCQQFGPAFSAIRKFFQEMHDKFAE